MSIRVVDVVERTIHSVTCAQETAAVPLELHPSRNVSAMTDSLTTTRFVKQLNALCVLFVTLERISRVPVHRLPTECVLRVLKAPQVPLVPRLLLTAAFVWRDMRRSMTHVRELVHLHLHPRAVPATVWLAH